MLVLNYTTRKECETLDAYDGTSQVFVLCEKTDVPALCATFNLDETTAIPRASIDESVHFTAHKNYDYASLIYADASSGSVITQEINVYISHKFFILAIPQNASGTTKEIETQILEYAKSLMQNEHDTEECITGHFNQMLFIVLNALIAYYSTTLEQLEDTMHSLIEQVTQDTKDSNLQTAQSLRKALYYYKKILRSYSYLGLQILCNENDVIQGEKLHLFRSADTRFRNLYNFAENVYELNTELLNAYDGKTAQRTNNIVNRLTAITFIFAPLGLMADIFGMNFAVMPGMQYPWAYPLALASMLCIGIVLYNIMKRQKWF